MIGIGTSLVNVAVSGSEVAVTYPTAQEIAAELITGGQLTHMILLADSRHAGEEGIFTNYAAPIVWGGAMSLGISPYNGGTGFTATSAAAATDGQATSPHIGGTATYAPLDAREVLFDGTATAAANDQAARCYIGGAPYASNFGELYRQLYARGEGVTAKLPVYLHAQGHTQPGVRWWFQTDGLDAPGARGAVSTRLESSVGSGYALLEASIAPGYDWSAVIAGTDQSVGQCVIDKGEAGIANEILALPDRPWIEGETGTVLHSYARGGRSIEGYLDPAFPDALWSDYFTVFGSRFVLWIDIGTNNTAGNSQAQHEDKLTELIEKARAGLPANTGVVLTSAYPAATDASEPYYSLAAAQVAANVPGVAFLNTWLAAPTYAEGNALGWYADTVHRNATGSAAHAALVGNILIEQSGLVRPPPVASPAFWGRGDDFGCATTDGRWRTTDVYTSIPDRGSVGGSWTTTPTHEPTVSYFGIRPAPLLKALTRIEPTADLSNFRWLHDGVTSGTFSMRIRLDSLLANKEVFRTTDGTAPGFRLVMASNGYIVARTHGTGGANTSFSQVDASLASGVTYTLTVKKSGAVWYVYVDGTQRITATVVGAPVDTDPQRCELRTNDDDDVIVEWISYDAALSDTDRGAVETYLDRWDYTP